MSKKIPPVDAPPPPQVTVVERRLQSPSVFGSGSPAIRLKDPSWTIHIINTDIKRGRYHEVVGEKGWVPVEAQDVDGDPADFGFETRNGRLVRGERGTEVLMKMPTRYVEQVAQRKAAENTAQVNPKRLKRDVVQQAAGQYSDQAASFLEQNITIKSERAPVPLDAVDAPPGEA